MKKRLLLFAGLLAVLTRVQADDGTLSITNIRNVVPGQTGSFDIVINGSTNTYRDFQLDLTLPEGLSYNGYTAGALLNGHLLERSAQAGASSRITGYTSPTQTMTDQTGTLLTVSFNVASTATGELSGGSLSNIRLSDAGAVSHALTNAAISVTVPAMAALSENGTPTAQTGAYVTFNRDFTAGNWATICLPFPMTAAQVTAAFGAGVKIGDFNGYTVSGNTINVNFASVTAIEANHPYIIKVASDISSFSITDATVDINPTVSPTINKGDVTTIKAMTGVYAETTLTSNKLYLKGNNFKYSTGTTKVAPYHAYFDFGDFSASGARVVTFTFDDQPTGIKALTMPGNGSDAIYDLQGRRVETPSDGVYIQNGRKSVNKKNSIK